MVTLLIAEDDDALRGVYEKAFPKQGWTVRFADTIDDTILKMNQEQPSLMILDLILQDKYAYPVLEERKKKEYAFPIVVLSNDQRDYMEEKCRKLGADRYFLKNSMTMRKLIKLIGGMVG